MRALQTSHVAFVNRQGIPDTSDKECAFVDFSLHTIAGYNDGSDTPMNFKDVLGHKNQKE
jgi:hypothetical protein